MLAMLPALPLLLLELAARFVLGFFFGLFGLGAVMRLLPSSPALALVVLVVSILLPIPLFVGALLRTYLTTLWTLAWREWVTYESQPITTP